MVNVDQGHDLQTRTKKKTGNKPVTVVFGTVVNYYWIEKAIYSTYSDYVFPALYNQLAKCMLCIKLPCFPCLAAAYFSTLSDKRYNFQKKILKICPFIFCVQINSETSFLKQTLHNFVINIFMCSFKVFGVLLSLQPSIIFPHNCLENAWNIKYLENPSILRQFVRCGW